MSNKNFKDAIFSFILILAFAVSGCAKPIDSTDDFAQPSSSIEDSLPKLDKNTLENWGDFEKVESLYTRLNRNLDNPNYVLVTLKNVVVMRGGDNSDRNGMTDNIWVISEESLLTSNRLTSSGEFIQLRDSEKIRVIMKDDTTNRALHGDYITVTGILDTNNIMIFDAEYEMVKSVN